MNSGTNAFTKCMFDKHYKFRFCFEHPVTKNPICLLCDIVNRDDNQFNDFVFSNDLTITR